MTMIDDGGPAFPLCDPANEVSNTGISLRDWLAGQALSQATREIWAHHKPEDVAARCYQHADAMLAARATGAS